MSLASVLLLVTFLESLATIFVERGVYFYTKDRLAFSDAQNVWLALAFGSAYAIGAWTSHRLARLAGERRLLLGTICGQLLCHAVLAGQASAGVWGVGPTVVICATLLGWFNGVKWPLIESYVSAGYTPAQQAKIIGRFNISWASAVPLALLIAWPILASKESAWVMFALPAALNLACILLLRPIPAQPVYLAVDHPQRPPEAELRRLEGLLAACRWVMLSSYALMFILAPLMPGVFLGLGFSAGVAAALSGLMDVLRVGTFGVLGRTGRWHFRIWPVLVSLAALPVGFALVLFGGTTPVVLIGEIAFGMAAGLIYYCALYYAMVVKNAAVEAGGAHEGLIGLGFSLGPAAMLVGTQIGQVLPPWTQRLTQWAGGKPELWGTLVGVTPLFVICAVLAIRQVVRIARAS